MINKTDREIKIHTDQGTCYGHMVRDLFDIIFMFCIGSMKVVV